MSAVTFVVTSPLRSARLFVSCMRDAWRDDAVGRRRRREAARERQRENARETLIMWLHFAGWIAVAAVLGVAAILLEEAFGRGTAILVAAIGLSVFLERELQGLDGRLVALEERLETGLACLGERLEALKERLEELE